MATGVVTWSQTANTNANADTNLNWAEGMAPSAVNDQARALMTSVAKYRDDRNGSIVTTGGSTSYTISTNQVFGTLTANYEIFFCPHTTNGDTVVINVDTLGAKPLRSAPGVEIPAGVLIAGTPYGATYKTTNSGEWILRGYFGNPTGILVGMATPYLGTTAPNAAFALPFGQALSRTTYASLYALCSTNFGSGDGVTTFNLIDLRGRLPVGWDSMGGTSTGRISTSGSSIDGTSVGASGGAENVILQIINMPSHDHGGATGNPTTHPSLNANLTNQQVTPTGAGFGGPNANSALLPDHVHTISAEGGGSAHGNVQPSIVCPWIVRII